VATEVTETERKYDAPPGAALPDLADLPEVAAESDPEEQTLRADYYDTDDLRLIRSGITLRRRTGGTDAGWHLKLPLGGDSRIEIRLPPGRASRQVPAELAKLVRDRAAAPASMAELGAYYEQIRPRLYACDEAKQALRLTFHPPVPDGNRVLKLGLPPVSALAFSTLPRWARRMYGRPSGPLSDMAATAGSGPRAWRSVSSGCSWAPCGQYTAPKRQAKQAAESTAPADLRAATRALDALSAAPIRPSDPRWDASPHPP